MVSQLSEISDEMIPRKGKVTNLKWRGGLIRILNEFLRQKRWQ